MFYEEKQTSIFCILETFSLKLIILFVAIKKKSFSKFNMSDLNNHCSKNETRHKKGGGVGKGS